jgi:hypothetical protein
MGLLDKIIEYKQTVSESTSESKFSAIADELVGSKPKVQNYAQVEEPSDNFDRFSQEDIHQGREFLQQQGFQSHEFQRDLGGIDINDAYLMSLAKLKVSSLNLKSNLLIEPMRIGVGFAFKHIDRHDIAEQIKTINIDDDLENFNELLTEVVYQEIKALQRANNLRIPPATELMREKVYMMMQKLAGEGFQNVIELSDGLYKKYVKKV